MLYRIGSSFVMVLVMGIALVGINVIIRHSVVFEQHRLMLARLTGVLT